MALLKSEEEIPLTYFMWLKIDFSPLFSPRSILVFYPKSIPYNLIIEQHHVKKPVNLQALIFIFCLLWWWCFESSRLWESGIRRSCDFDVPIDH